ncbi:FERM N-terminal domain family protein [Acanthocheilonema viteae]
MGKRESEGEIGNIQRTMDQQPATVELLDSTKHIFYVSKKAEGGELFDKVCAFLNLSEKDYFALCFIDSDGNQQWIYDDKRISKQLKGHSWNFIFQVKFYPPEPATLAEDRTRHFLCLQVRHDISTGKLPATLATHALLGSYVAQSVRGDYEPSLQYIDFLRSCDLAPAPNETLYEKVEELHKHHKGETSAEADLHYLENAKKLSMYGVQLFHAKDGKGTPVQIGISAHGINVYLDQIRVHRFLWQNIIKIGYRRNIFVIKVKPGELEKNESTAAFKLVDYEAAKRVWKCGVEHHTFFRLIQPEEKPHRGLFRWGSARFRYQGRTQFQSKMASQMFYNSHPVQRSQSVRVTQNDGNVTVPVSTSQTLPLMHSESGTGRELEWSSSQMISPEKIYSTHVMGATQNRENNMMPNGAEVGNTNNTSGKSRDSVHYSAIFTTSVTTTTTTTNSAVITTTITTPTTTITSTTVTEHFKQPLLPHVSSHSIKIARGTGSSMHEFSNGDFHSESRYLSDNLHESKSVFRREKDMEFLPVEDKAVVYHPGHYEEVTGSHSRQFREPPIEPGDDFVLVHRPKLGSVGKIFHQSGAETDILVKEEDIGTYPIHHFADVYHSGFSRPISGNKDFEAFEHKKYLKTDDVADKPGKKVQQTVDKQKYSANEKFPSSGNKDSEVFEHKKYLKTDDIADKFGKNIRQTVDKQKYPASEKFKGPILHTEKSMELPIQPLRIDTHVYNQGYYDTIDATRTDTDEKGNIRNWLSCYKKPEKSPTKLLKEKNKDVKEKMEKSASKLDNSDHTVNESGAVDDQENQIKKIAVIHIKQPGYERQIVQTSYYNAESSEREHEKTTYLKESKLVTSALEANKSFSSSIKEKAYDSTKLKQTCHLFVSTADSYRVEPGAYGMPSTSYDEQLYNIKRENELPSLPIREYVTVYHPGMSIIKDKKRRKFLIRKEQQKATSSEASTDEEMQSDKGKKWTAILDISRADKSDLTNVDSVEKRSINEETRTKHVTSKMKENEYLDPVKLVRTIDSETQKSTQKIKDKKKDTKSVDTQNVKSESTRQKMKAILHINESQSKSSYTGKETVLKKADESKNIQHTTRSTFSILGIGKLGEKAKKAELLEQSCNIHILDNTPPPVKLSRVTEIPFQPLHRAVKMPNQIQNMSYNYRTFKRAKHKGTVEFVAKENINPKSYRLEHTPYQGPLDIISFTKGLQFAPIHEYSTVYHHGNTYLKSRKINKRRNASEIQNEEKPGILKSKKIDALQLNKNDYFDAKYHEEEKNDSEVFLAKKKDQVTMYAAKIYCKTPMETRKVKKHPFKYHTISGDVEIVEKSFVKPETYKLDTVPYDGPISCLEHGKELSFTPLQECTAAYHSGISHKTRLRDSSTESSSSSSFSSGSSSSSKSSSYISKKYKEPKKNIILHVTPSNKRDTNDVATESPKRKGIFTFWRKTVHSEKEGGFSDNKKEKLDASPKSYLIHQQPELSTDFTAKQTTSSPSVLVKDSVEEPKSDLHVKSENKKMNAHLYIKNKPSTASEYADDNSKRAKFGLLHFWRSADKENKLNSKKCNFVIDDMNSCNEEPLDHTINSNSSHEEANVQLATGSKKKPIIYVIDKEENELDYSTDMEEKSLNHSAISPTDQNKANIETKKNVMIYLKRDTEFSDDVPLNLNGNRGIFKQENAAAAAMCAISPHASSSKNSESGKLSNIKESQLVDKSITLSPKNIDSIESNLRRYDKSGDVGYTAKIKVKRNLRNAGNDLQQDSNLKAKEINVSDDGVTKKSSFIIKGFHLRGPPCESEAKIVTNSELKKDAHIAEAVETGEATVTKKQKADFPDNADKPIPYEEPKMKLKLTGSDNNLKENKRDSGKNIKGSFFSSLWRGSKLKGYGQDVHRKREKLTGKDIHGTESAIMRMTSPSNELEYNILQTKYILDSAESSSNGTQVREQTRQDFIPVYDFSYVPNFSALIEDTKMSTGTAAGYMTKQIGFGGEQDDATMTDKIISETGEQKESKLKQWFSDCLKDMEEYNNMSALSEDQDENWRQEQSEVMEKTFVSELIWEKVDVDTERQKVQYMEPGILETGKLFDQSGISGGEISDEPYKFTQTPPDIPVLDSKTPSDFVEEAKRQVTQVVTKTLPSSDIGKKLEKRKKRSKIEASPDESESSNTSEMEIASHYDSFSFNQAKKGANKPEVTSELPSDQAELDGGCMLLKEIKEMYGLKSVETLPVTHPANVDSSLPHANIELWQETVISEPEAVVTSVDHQENIIKKGIKTRQVTHTVQQKTYQTSSASSQNENSEIEATEKSFVYNGNENMTSFQGSIMETPDNKSTYEPTTGINKVIGNDYSDIPGELVSSRTVTQGNRTIETITYKTEKNGTMETHVEHRVTIHSCDDIDHDAELSQAILEATNMNPDMTVEKIEVKHETQC